MSAIFNSGEALVVLFVLTLQFLITVADLEIDQLKKAHYYYHN
jgi:hypothetical protein